MGGLMSKEMEEMLILAEEEHMKDFYNHDSSSQLQDLPSTLEITIDAPTIPTPSEVLPVNKTDVRITTATDVPPVDEVDVSITLITPTLPDTSEELVSSTDGCLRNKPNRSKQPYLFLDKPQVLTKTNKLMSGDINKAQAILKKQHPEKGGLFYCTIGGSLEFPRAQGDQWLQIVHDGSDHWVLVAKGSIQHEHVLVYDSSPGHPWRNEHVLSCMSSLLQSSEKEMTYIIKDCQRQSNGYDCGVFAIAFATSLAFGEDPAIRMYDPKKLRPHFVQCMASGKLTPFPSVPSHATRTHETVEAELWYCTCRRTGWEKNDWSLSDVTGMVATYGFTRCASIIFPKI
ncbi:hypothetical protein GHT06_009095 [Daphnia sinensis]|uniref:Ubiquitin-like protease family profile domain-containing protein n=1 Tax=Daphnia sinensis TaxID=1820382 RepID=A0AAD5PYZ7_9CRUS|nr:hypothetical protein GHT06_009095 [Daphnia sinensis]